MDFNFDATAIYKICSLGDQQVNIFVDRLMGIENEIVDNMKQYTHIGTDENTDEEGLHRGLVLKKLREEFSNENEFITVLISFERICDDIYTKYSHTKLKEKIQGFVDKIFDK